MSIIICPACGQKRTGQVGNRRHYCWSCFIEFQLDGNRGVRLFALEEDGSLVEFNKIEVPVTGGNID